MIALGMTLGLTPTTVHSQSSPLQDETSYSHRIAQGRYFLEDGLLNQALREFEQASSMKEGRQDPLLHTLLARTHFRLGDVAASVAAAKTAERGSEGEPDPQLAELLEFLLTRFGKVTVIGGGTDGYLPETAAPLLDPELKRIFLGSLERMAAPATAGTTSMYLPVGNYRVGGHILEVVAGTTTRMDLRSSVGRAAAGVYGERRQDSTSGARLATTPVARSSLLVRMGGHGFYQQTNGSGGGRVLVAWTAAVARERISLLAAGTLSLQRMERIVASDPAPGGLLPGALVAVGPVVRPSPRLVLTPRIGWSIGYGHPLESGLPEGYRGPIHYLVHGPELEATLRFRVQEVDDARETVSVEPVVGARLFFQESTPLGSILEADRKSHLTFGVGFEFGLQLGS
ncbi:MAG: hypothetical protein CL928_15480 [Deltaproteobacteria bacterium]|nr:hypothetical protein [Deltaproteobacteria bacterium]